MNGNLKLAMHVIPVTPKTDVEGSFDPNGLRPA
jgi:hypothetical protein